MRLTPHAQSILRFAQDLGADHGYEYSFKLIAGALLDNRFLITFPLRAIPGSALASLTALGRTLNMPPPLISQMATRMPEADLIHLGFEQQGDRHICKIYLEYAKNFHLALQQQSPVESAQLVHFALKWDANNPSHQAIACYRCQPNLSQAAMDERITRMYEGNESSPALTITRKLLSMTLGRIAAEDVLFMTVEEPGNPRQSFDINLYDAGFNLADMAGPIHEMASYLKVPAEDMQTTLKRHHYRKLGHLSGGIDRKGEAFFSVYFGVENRKAGTVREANAASW